MEPELVALRDSVPGFKARRFVWNAATRRRFSFEVRRGKPCHVIL